MGHEISPGEARQMSSQDISLHDRFDLEKSPVLLNGTQALVRLMLMQKARDEAAGLDTGGFITGYRGSPVGGLDIQFMREEKLLKPKDIIFQPGLNEELAATAIWGAQQATIRGEGAKDGVFCIWYGKGPGVDRCGDVFRHANAAGCMLEDIPLDKAEAMVVAMCKEAIRHQDNT